MLQSTSSQDEIPKTDLEAALSPDNDDAVDDQDDDEKIEDEEEIKSQP